MLDATLGVFPESTTQVCPVLAAGLLTVTLRAVGKAKPKPVRFAFHGWRPTDVAAEMEWRVTNDERTESTTLRGGHYCITLRNDAIPQPTASLAELGSFRQDIAIRVTLTPQ